MLPILKQFLQDFAPLLTPFYFLGAWLLVILTSITFIGLIVDLIKRTKKMHEIPCTNCQYFTNDYRLKCTVQPNIASTENAISCPDFSLKHKY